MKCIYCGEEEATEKMCSPNGLEDSTPIWDVCKGCKETITQQQKLSFGAILSSMKDNFSKDYGEKIMSEANTELKKIAKRDKKPILNSCIYKKKDGSYDSTSVKFTGD